MRTVKVVLQQIFEFTLPKLLFHGLKCLVPPPVALTSPLMIIFWCTFWIFYFAFEMFASLPVVLSFKTWNLSLLQQPNVQAVCGVWSSLVRHLAEKSVGCPGCWHPEFVWVHQPVLNVYALGTLIWIELLKISWNTSITNFEMRRANNRSSWKERPLMVDDRHPCRWTKAATNIVRGHDIWPRRSWYHSPEYGVRLSIYLAQLWDRNADLKQLFHSIYVYSSMRMSMFLRGFIKSENQGHGE